MYVLNFFCYWTLPIELDWACSSDCLQSIFICEWVLTNIHFTLVSNIKKNYQRVVKGYITTGWFINVCKELFKKRHLKSEYEFDEVIKAEGWWPLSQKSKIKDTNIVKRQGIHLMPWNLHTSMSPYLLTWERVSDYYVLGVSQILFLNQ